MDREAVDEFSPEEVLYRRYRLVEPDLTAAISFNRMSVNRSNFCTGADDVLWNGEVGGRFEDFGVIEIDMEGLLETVDHPSLPVSFRLKAQHEPTQCNYPHSEVIAVEVNQPDGPERELSGIKPTSVKLKFRENLQRFIKVAIPVEQKGQRLPISSKT
ncbi:MAG: hypothetical protein JJT96_15670 [Opitutales bacterium]|nr:hypothetical protein [Opitutales bacterium]